VAEHAESAYDFHTSGGGGGGGGAFALAGISHGGAHTADSKAAESQPAQPAKV